MGERGVTAFFHCKGEFSGSFQARLDEQSSKRDEVCNVMIKEASAIVIEIKISINDKDNLPKII